MKLLPGRRGWPLLSATLNLVTLGAVTHANALRVSDIRKEARAMTNLDKYTSPVVRKALVYVGEVELSRMVHDRITCCLVPQTVGVSFVWVYFHSTNFQLTVFFDIDGNRSDRRRNNRRCHLEACYAPPESSVMLVRRAFSIAACIGTLNYH